MTRSTRNTSSFKIYICLLINNLTNLYHSRIEAITFHKHNQCFNEWIKVVLMSRRFEVHSTFYKFKKPKEIYWFLSLIGPFSKTFY